MDILGKGGAQQPRDSTSGVVRRETPMIHVWDMCKPVHRRWGDRYKYGD